VAHVRVSVAALAQAAAVNALKGKAVKPLRLMALSPSLLHQKSLTASYSAPTHYMPSVQKLQTCWMKSLIERGTLYDFPVVFD
jgi:hypothetical protein